MVMERYVFIRSDSARLIAKKVDLKEDVVKFKYKTLDEWVYKAYELQRSLMHPSLMKDKDYNESDAIALIELAMRCLPMSLARVEVASERIYEVSTQSRLMFVDRFKSKKKAERTPDEESQNYRKLSESKTVETPENL
ncbi:hypothetical protein LguiB_013756 [Lonicera macranthoides]